MSDQKGMSLLEMMIVFAVLSIILVGAYTFINFSYRQYSWIDTQSKVNQDLRAVIQEMTIDIKEAKAVLYASPNTLVMSLPNMDTYGNIPIYWCDTITYFVDTGVNPAKLKMRLVKGTGSRRRGWGDKVSGNDTNSLWTLCTYIDNHSSEDPRPIFSYNSETTSLITECTVTLRIRRHASFGKFQKGIISTSVRLRNKRNY